MRLPELRTAHYLESNKRRLFVGAYGFEDRSLGWLDYQPSEGDVISHALMFRYNPSKGHQNNPNKIEAIQKELKAKGVHVKPVEIEYNWHVLDSIENEIEQYFEAKLSNIDEVIVDISSMTKFLILVCLCKLINFQGIVRIIYSEAENYSPSFDEYEKSREDMAFLTKYPSQGVRAIARARCLSSIRMQGQPITLITFTSFNEQLVRQLLGTMNPHRLIFINGHPPREAFTWRAKATQDIHRKLIEEYFADNPFNDNGYLVNGASTLNYIETVDKIDEIYNKLGSYERIICGATGSKMQTVGLFFAKVFHPDIHIEYPTPDSYYIEGLSTGIRKIHELFIQSFSKLIVNREKSI